MVNLTSHATTSWEPLYLSTIAGLSTCIGAAVVFCQPQNEHNTKVVPPNTMAFSLALAGSVMVTVSVVSILPEVLMEDNNKSENRKERLEYKMINIFSMTMFYRILFFGLGSFLYFLLSLLLNVPEPEDLLDGILLADKNDEFTTHDKTLIMTNTNVDNDMDSESEMIELISNSPSKIEDGFGERPLRGRKSQSTIGMNSVSTRKLSPGDNNGKLKSNLSNDNLTSSTNRTCLTPDSKNFCEDGFSLKEWTSGKDLNSEEKRKAWRIAILLFISLLVHNFPEGLAVAASALESSKLGLTVTVGIMIHNIPEGIAIAIPCLAARPDEPWLSFILASISGLAEPVGAFVALLFLKDVKGEMNKNSILCLENILSFVSGIMIMVALWELFPEARRQATTTRKYFWYGTLSGIILMISTELYLP